jgi:predicted RNase H-like HicB family nuclease
MKRRKRADILATSPLPGVNTQGETLDEARENLLEAMRMILEANREEAESRLSDKPGITREQLTLRAA